MRLPRFEYLEPADLEEALEMRASLGKDCAVLAGGTDLLVRMKQRLAAPKYLLSLKGLHHLDGMAEEDGVLRIGARTSLGSIGASPLVQRLFPALAQAVRAVGAPTIQHVRGTLGGNLCQDTRCLFYNQSAFWRSGRQACHKAGGRICYAREGSDRCRSTYQSDGGPALVALDARVTLRRKGGERTLPLGELFTGKGEDPIGVEPQELLTHVLLRLPGRGEGSAYERLAYRSAIDYPVTCAAVHVQVDGSAIQRARVVVGALANAPLLMAQVGDLLKGKDVTDAQAVDRAASLAIDHASAFAVDNVGSDVEYRVQMVSVLVRKALEVAIGRARASLEVEP